MMNLFSAIELGKNSLLTQQKVFQVIGQNIANVNTPGYTRQVVQLESVAPAVIGLHSGGRGVNLVGIHSIRDSFITGQIAERKQYEGKFQSLSSSLLNIESLFDETHGNGLSDSMSDFFNMWADLSNQPTDIPTRRSLVYTAQSFSSSIQNTYQRLIDQQELHDSNIGALVKDINAIAYEIASLNEKIAYAKGSGQPANDLLDHREMRIKELSGKIGINVYYNEANSSATVEVGGRPMVSFASVNELSAIRSSTPPQYFEVHIDQYGGPTVDITNILKNGEMEALIEMRDTLIPEYREMLDDLALGLIYNVNSLHQQGFALDGFTRGLNFFDMSNGPGTVAAGGIAGTTVTFSGLAGNISNNLQIGDMITINGQSRLVTAVTDPNQITINAAFNPDPEYGAPATWSGSWEYVNQTGAASLIAVESNIIADPELVSASSDIYSTTPVAGLGVIASAGTALTFSQDINAQGIEVGSIITASGQSIRITSIAANGLSATSETAFAPPAAGAWTWQNFSGAVGNNEIALQISGLIESNLTVDADNDGNLEYGSFHDYLHSIMGKIGNDSFSAQYELEANSSMLNYLENRRDELSAVSLDEEAANLMQFEKSYQSLAQYVGVVNRLTDVLIQIGRY